MISELTTTLNEPGHLGLAYPKWRASQRQALEFLAEHESGFLGLQPPTGSGKSGIALGWAFSQARDTSDPTDPKAVRRTLLLSQRNVELTQYESLFPAEPDGVGTASVREQNRYHFPHLAAELRQME